jgi:hypothetical protein
MKDKEIDISKYCIRCMAVPINDWNYSEVKDCICSCHKELGLIHIERKWLHEIKGCKYMTIKEWIYEFYYMIKQGINHSKRT